MKLVVQIPCYNEQDSVLEVLKNIPKKINGIKKIEVYLIDDGSSDKTCEIASEYVDEIIKINKNVGLANAIKIGVRKALENNADILVNIDGDNQYDAKCIEKIVEPIIKSNVDMVIGVRPIDKIKTFSVLEKIIPLQTLKSVEGLFLYTIRNYSVSRFS